MPGRDIRYAAKFLLPLVAGGLFFLTGCNGETPTPNKAGTTPAKTHADGDEHDHDHHHHHAEHGPHEGALVAIGHDDAHVEFVLKADSGTLTAYVLDGEAEKAVAVKQASLQVAVTLTKGDEEGDKEGDVPKDVVVIMLKAVSPSDDGTASEFEGQADKLKGAEKFAAVLTTITVKGKAFPNVGFKYPEGNEDDHHHH